MIGDKKIVSLCISKISDEVCHEMITSLGESLREMGCGLFVYGTPTDLFWETPNENGEMSIFGLVDMNVTDALIIFSEKIKRVAAVEELERRAREAGVPVISIGNTGGRCYDVEFDYEAGFEDVVRHVMEVHKPKSVHFMAGMKGNDFSDQRLNVFKRVIRESDICYDDSMVSYGEFWSMPTIEATEKLIAENRLPEAIICANDSMAIAVCNVLRKHGLSVPQDIIVTGFDGILEINFSVPKMTSCKCYYNDMAKKCVEVISLLWEGKEAPHSNRIIPQLILSESCGCSFTEKMNASEHLCTLNDMFYRYREENRSFAELVSRMQNCYTVEEAARFMNKRINYDFCCILSPDCIDDSVNPHMPSGNEVFSEKMFLFFDSDYPNDPPREFMKQDIIPHLDRQLEMGYPIIFVAINSLDIPLGYICFHFHSNDIGNYMRISQTVSALNNAIGGLRNIRYQQYLTKQLEGSYKIDTLTGLYNRRGFSHEYKELLSKLKADECLTVVLSDLDGLKQINDRYGHGEGDRAIRTAAKALRHACGDSAICVRFGGDEMLAVIRGAADEKTIRQAAEEFLCEHNSSSGKPYKVSASLGIYVTDNGSSLDFEELIKRSDILMYADKERKKKGAGK